MNIVFDLFLIQFIIVNLIDLSGFIQELETMLGKWLHIRAKIPKPFSCSYCLTWWVGLIYLIATGNFTLPYIAILLTFSYLTECTRELIYLFNDIIIKILQIIHKLIS